MREEVEVLMRFYDEQCQQARHHEDHREKVTQMVIAVSTALIAFIAVNSLQPWTVWLALAVLALPFYSAPFCFKHYERNRHHVRYARNYRRMIEELVDDVPLRDLREDARHDHRDAYPLSSAWRLHSFWLSINYVIGLIGAILAIIIVARSYIPGQ